MKEQEKTDSSSRNAQGEKAREYFYFTHLSFQGSAALHEGLTLYRNEQDVGGIDYCWDPEQQWWEIEYINMEETERRQGYAVKLLTEFVKRAGSNQPVHAVVIHDETVEYVLRQYRASVEAMKKLALTESEQEELPLVRLLKKGNIDVTKVTIDYERDRETESMTDSLQIHLWGKTR